MKSFSIFEVSATAMDAQRKRMNVIASNMANVHSTKSEEGGPYRRKDVVFATVSAGGPSNIQTGVRVEDVVRDMSPFKTVHDPSHPDADKDGNVSFPNINIIEEMVNMMMAFRAYEASLSAFNLSKSMTAKALELGRQ